MPQGRQRPRSRKAVPMLHLGRAADGLFRLRGDDGQRPGGTDLAAPGARGFAPAATHLENRGEEPLDAGLADVGDDDVGGARRRAGAAGDAAREERGLVEGAGRPDGVGRSGFATAGGTEHRRDGGGRHRGDEKTPPADIEGRHRRCGPGHRQTVLQGVLGARRQTVEADVALADPVFVERFVGALAGHETEGAAGAAVVAGAADPQRRQPGGHAEEGAEGADRAAVEAWHPRREQQDRRQHPERDPAAGGDPAEPQGPEPGGDGAVEEGNRDRASRRGRRRGRPTRGSRSGSRT